LERNTRDINSKSKELEGLRAERDDCNQQLADARAEQARSRSTLIQKEKRIKKADQNLEAKVHLVTSLRDMLKAILTRRNPLCSKLRLVSYIRRGRSRRLVPCRIRSSATCRARRRNSRTFSKLWLKRAKWRMMLLVRHLSLAPRPRDQFSLRQAEAQAQAERGASLSQASLEEYRRM
jgi:chromosome segregation ATPase